MRRLLRILPAAALAACHQPAPHPATETTAPEAAPPVVEHSTSEATARLGLPFSDAVRVGSMLYLSGQIGNRPGTLELVPGGVAEETRQTLENVGAILEANGSSFDRVVKCTVMLADIADWPAVNGVYETYFAAGRLPARSAFAGSGLALGARVEIECWATVGPG